jgi:hypothetical protein
LIWFELWEIEWFLVGRGGETVGHFSNWLARAEQLLGVPVFAGGALRIHWMAGVGGFSDWIRCFSWWHTLLILSALL